MFKIDLEEIRRLETDNRGRLNLGSRYSNKTVKVAVLEICEDEEPAQ